tara:strand:+ start:44 stop:244 length:201 start_codon:yes stop_codon:yes gene_type:complete
MKSDDFFDWVYDSDYRFKDDCHKTIAMSFDPCAVVRQTQDGWYGDKTKVIFSDGSIAEFNYKGESE